jgi:hypothetical protein
VVAASPSLLWNGALYRRGGTAKDLRPTRSRAQGTSDSALDVLGHLQGIIDVDTKVPNRTFDLAVTQEQLH